MDVERLDHLVLTAKDMEKTCSLYTQVLRMPPVPLPYIYQRINF